MGKGKKRSRIEDISPDLTPMIDCVFLLLIFFMIITEITQSDLEHMELPKAEMADPDEKPPPERLVINIVKQNPTDPEERRAAFKIKGQELGKEELVARLFEEAEKHREKNEDTKIAEGMYRCDRPVLVRCDKRVYYRYFEDILMYCANPKLGIFMAKIEIAIAKEDQ